MLSPGTMLNDRYRLTQRIAAGGMGEVWRGEDLMLHRPIAVKTILPALMADREFLQRFRTEARMMAALRHPGIVQVYDYGENAQVGGNRTDYLVMEFIEGISLAKRIEQAGRLSPGETMTIVAQVADALQVAHEAGIVHRDVKPANLLVRRNGAIVLVDFGVARSAAGAGLTGTNVVLGSVNYMAPEQAEAKKIGPQTDVYALGAVAYCCLTGRPPYVGDNPLQVMSQLVYGDLPTLPADVPPPVAALVLRALAKEPSQRFSSAAEMATVARSPGRPPNTQATRFQGPTNTQATRPYGQPGPATSGRMPAPAVPPRGYQNTGSARPVSPGYQNTGSARPVSSGGYQAGRASAGVPPQAGYGTSSGRMPAAGAAAIPLPGAGVADSDRGSGSGPGSAAGRNRRRNIVLASAIAAVVVGVGGIGVAFAMSDSAGEDTSSNGVIAGDTSPSTKPPKTRKPASTPRTKNPAPEPTETTEEPEPEPSETETENPITAEALCGDDFQEVDQGKVRDGDGQEVGQVHLLSLNEGEQVCTVTLRSVSNGEKISMSAYAEVDGQPRANDRRKDEFSAGGAKAGPVADGSCVKWGGVIDGSAYDGRYCAD
ncbi:serine/threonine-protein kinase [Paractinoplanes hotanensis]|uniref:non-specific serine/threonine protein kinase n=1 Tax=Paractinoplanes hotanensis TaxID=2906497 RepID=A0ABT0XWH2_9ACTN|nr:serine/threonine-protein kinase [Actinoplanes hotanensis]MCM4077537.1 protein kinase [Actinoplanes hotanensis]